LDAALNDTDPVVRVYSADAAIETRFGEAALRVGNWFGEKDASVRLAAAKVLAAFPENNPSVARLSRALGDPDARVRRAVAHALGVSSRPEATAALLARLDDSDPDVAVAVIEALERLGDKKSVVPLISRLSDNRSKLRRAVVVALGTLGSSASVSALTLALRDSDKQVRLAAVSALGRTHDEGAVDALRSVLTGDPAIDVRVAALTALSEIPSPRTTTILIAELDSPRSEIASEAAELLRIKHPLDADQLTFCLQGQPATERAEGCARALAAQHVEGAYETITGAWRRRVIGTLAALQSYGELGDPRALTDALEQLEAPRTRIRVAAVSAAARLLDASEPDGRAVEPITTALESAREVQERVALVDLLGRTRSPRAIPFLVPFMDRKAAVQLRLSALRALGRIGTIDGADGEEDPVGALLSALSDSHAPVRFEAAHAIRRAGTARMLPELFDKLDKEAAQDRQAVALALAGPLSRLERARVKPWVTRLGAAVAVSSDATADALVEALANAPGAATDATLFELAGNLALRAKVIEVMGARAQQSEERSKLGQQLVTALKDSAPAVRANAAWGLGVLKDQSTAAVLRKAYQDADVAVSVNALAALGRLGIGAAAREDLCSALKAPHPYVRANALVGLRLSGLRCDARSERWLLERDQSAVVRQRAAALIAAVQGPQGELDRAALERCARADTDGTVAADCLAAVSGFAPESPKASDLLEQNQDSVGTTVYVVPAGRQVPQPRAPFTLVEGDGLLRVGVADRRGAVYAARQAASDLKLEVPAPLLR
jgi:HEAT repeat protein